MIFEEDKLLLCILTCFLISNTYIPNNQSVTKKNYSVEWLCKTLFSSKVNNNDMNVFTLYRMDLYLINHFMCFVCVGWFDTLTRQANLRKEPSSDLISYAKTTWLPGWILMWFLLNGWAWLKVDHVIKMQHHFINKQAHHTGTLWLSPLAWRGVIIMQRDAVKIQGVVDLNGFVWTKE